MPTGKLDERHAPQDAPYPPDDDDESGQLQQPDNNVDSERSRLGLDSSWRAAVEHAERRHQRPYKSPYIAQTLFSLQMQQTLAYSLKWKLNRNWVTWILIIIAEVGVHIVLVVTWQSK